LQNVAQPGRVGILMEGDAERRRCGTWLSRIEAVEAHCIVAKDRLLSALPKLVDH
jgi:hypothetical protein